MPDISKLFSIQSAWKNYDASNDVNYIDAIFQKQIQITHVFIGN